MRTLVTTSVLLCILVAQPAAPALSAPSSPPAPPAAQGTLAQDPAPHALLQAPQDLMFFATQAGLDTPLLTPAEQAKRDARSNALFFGPWRQAKPSLSAQRFKHIRISKAKGFVMDTPWAAEAWAALMRNTHAERYPRARGAGITTAHADLRSMPTDLPLFLEATAEPTLEFFDFFQYASLATGTPVYVSHVSADEQWYYVEYPLLSGWVRADTVALVSRDFIRQYSARPLAAVLRENLPLTTADGVSLGKSHVGAVFPQGDKPGEIWVPVRMGDGNAALALVVVPQDSVQPKPLPLTPGNLARLGSQMLGQPYAWGGKGQGRDCSLLTRDLLLPFGLWLPRNSRHQAHTKDNTTLGQLSPAARKAKILREGRPFLTLLGFPGHVGLYVGSYQGEPVMLHNILGLRTTNAEEGFRHVIGKCVISTLESGNTMPELQLRETLLERLNGMRTLP